AIDLAQQSPSELNYGSPGPGTPHHLAMELLRQEADFDAVHVPYKGSAELVRGVLAGQVDFAFLPVHQALELSRADKLIMLSAGESGRLCLAAVAPRALTKSPCQAHNVARGPGKPHRGNVRCCLTIRGHKH